MWYTLYRRDVLHVRLHLTITLASKPLRPHRQDLSDEDQGGLDSVSSVCRSEPYTLLLSLTYGCLQFKPRSLEKTRPSPRPSRLPQHRIMGEGLRPR